MKNIIVMQSTIVQQTQKLMKDINTKDTIIDEFLNQVSIMRDECMREIDALQVKFKEVQATSDEKISELEEELRRRPEVLNVSPLTTLDTYEAKLVKILNEKYKFIKYLKAKFEKKT